MSTEDFAGDVQKFVEGAIEKTQKKRKALIFALFGDIIADTPVGNPDNWRTSSAPDGYVGGRLRTNWQTSSSGYSRGTIQNVDLNRPFREMHSNVKDDFKTVYFSNNLPYAARIEFTGWSWNQAPDGMVRKNVQRHIRKGHFS